MSYEHAVVTSPKALFDRIVAALQDPAFMGAANVWTLVYSYDGWGSPNTYANKVVKSFRCPGPTGLGDWHIVLRIEPSTGVNTTNFLFAGFEEDPLPPYGGATWQDRGTWSAATVAYVRGDVVLYGSTYYVCEVAHTSAASPAPNNAPGVWYPLGSQPGYMGALLSPTNQLTSYYGKVWNGGTGDLPYWLFANASRLMFVTRSDNRYHFGYAGGIVRMGAAASYALPILTAGNSTNAGDTFLNTANRNFPLAGTQSGANAAVLKCPGNRTASTNEISAYPPGYYPASTLAPIGRNPAGEFPLMPVMLGFDDSASGDKGVVGTLDGAFVTDNRGNASENVITIAGQDYLCIEDVYRAEGGQFLALKME